MPYFFHYTDKKLGEGREKGLRKFKVLQDINQPVIAKLLIFIYMLIFLHAHSCISEYSFVVQRN